MDKQWTNFYLAWSATLSHKYTTIHLFEGEGGDDANVNSDVVITADSKVGERQHCNELEMVVEDGERCHCREVVLFFTRQSAIMSHKYRQ